MSRKSLSLLVVCGFVLGFSVAHAQVPVDAPGPVVIAPMASEAGSAAPATVTTTTTTTVAPADAIPDPLANPVKALDAAKDAKQKGWAYFLLFCAVMLTVTLTRAAAKWPTAPVLSQIAKHKTVILVVTCGGFVSAAAFNALALGGDWMAVAYAGGGALLTFVTAGAKAPTA